MQSGAGAPARVLELLDEARRRRLLGPGDVGAQAAHALSFAAALGSFAEARPVRVIDLGSGGGLPGLVLAAAWPESRWTLVEAREQRVEFLQWSVAELGWTERVQVVHGRAEELARVPGQRAAYGLVTARSFGPPAVTAESAAPFLAVGGRLAVSEPPEGGDRWPPEGLAQLGLVRVEAGAAAHRIAVLEQSTLCPERFPRRPAVTRRRPLF
ncbi:MAG: RsmG family class I SAM-dependent methyltransferase [Acidimicrobiales bacterium]